MAQRWGYTGKEHQDELGLSWIDVSARNYDAALGRWMNIDPLAEDYYKWSPYNYSYNSPLRFNDPTGMGPVDPIGVFGALFKAANSMVNATISFLNMDPINIEGSGGSQVEGSGLHMRDGPGGEGYVGQTAKNAQYNVEIDHSLLSAVTGYRGMGPRNRRNGKTDATKKEKNAATAMNKEAKKVKEGFSDAKRVNRYREKVMSFFSLKKTLTLNRLVARDDEGNFIYEQKDTVIANKKSEAYRAVNENTKRNLDSITKWAKEKYGDWEKEQQE